MKRIILAKIELKPCPFCRSHAKWQFSSHTPTYPIGLRCNKCKVELYFFDKEENLITDFYKITNRFNKRK